MNHIAETQMTVSLATVIALVGVMITFAVTLGHVVFRQGQQNRSVQMLEEWKKSVNIDKLEGRVDGLEEWRKGVRGDMHEVSEELRALSNEVKKLSTIIEERTDRREGITRRPGPERT